MSLIVGIDPGSQFTGFAALRRRGTQVSLLESGRIRLTQYAELSDRLAILFTKIDELLKRLQPQSIAVEDIFTHRNMRSALLLGQARGTVLAAAGCRGLRVCSYAPALVKRSVAGYGRADKRQIQQMVRALLNMAHAPTADEADAIAIGLCHARKLGMETMLQSARVAS